MAASPVRFGSLRVLGINRSMTVLTGACCGLLKTWNWARVLESKYQLTGTEPSCHG